MNQFEENEINLPLTERKGKALRAESISESSIRRLVFTFYDRIQGHAKLGPVFSERISDWTPHLEKMCDFWSSATMRTGRYSGRPLPVHRGIPDLTAELYHEWLALFYQTTSEVFTESDAAIFNAMATRMAQNMVHALDLGQLCVPTGSGLDGA
ncbi:Group 3 truncated hemoglobin ctb [Poriferisphaera corsica]|uniref:Group 3 truncated hemoglobin ctb n=1 Tax=Poriferisphaera corsica TaxID=2528020 RepID=A0A517YVY7_9BACT|nr:group III truncated hemoglobin [Poriferisphaera corsica]QDU34387.1 Group 3 truncated hemoglobin ctb [Poriferisphaera corsica]